MFYLSEDKSLIYDGQPLLDDAKAAADRRGAVLGETLRKSFPVESGGTLPSHVVRLMLMLAHIEPTPSPTGEDNSRARNGRRRRLRRLAAIALGLAAAIVRRRHSLGRRSTPR